MAKTPLIIPDFSGGLVTFTDPRDLQEKQCQIATNLSVRYVGKLQQLGKFAANSDIQAMSNTIESGSTYVNFTNGQVFKVFSTDVKKDSSLASESYIAFVDKTTGKLWIHDETNKKWQYLQPYDITADIVFDGGNSQGIYGKIANAMTSGDKHDAAYYLADGGLRVCDPNFGNTTSEGPQLMKWKGTWDTSGAYVLNDVVVFDSGTNHDDKQYICISGHTPTDNDNAGTGRPVDGSGNVNTQWKLLNNQIASTMIVQHIKKDFFSGGLSVNDWHCHPARCFPFYLDVSTTSDGSLNQGFLVQNDTSSKSVSPGQVGFTLNLERNKGDGTLLMQGRKLYGTLTYDNSQESTPKEIGTITLPNITTLAQAPTEDELGYIVKLTKKALYGDDNIHLSHKVNDQDSTSSFIPNATKLNWDEGGSLKVIDNLGQTQTLSYTGFATGTAGNNNLFEGKADGADTDSAGGFVCTSDTPGQFANLGVTSDFQDGRMVGMMAKNLNTGAYAAITENDDDTFTCGSALTGGWNDEDDFRIEGVTLTGISGWIDTGTCNISHVVTSVIVNDGGGDYSSAPTVVFTATNGGSGAAATANMTGSGSNQSISSISITNHGSGYLTPPTITLAGGSGAAEANISAELTTSDACVNNGGTWTAADANIANSVEYDPPGEIQKDDEKLGLRLTCSIHPKSEVSGRKQVFDWNRGGNRVTKINIYTNKYSDDAGTIPESEDFAYICSFDLENGYENEDGTYEGWTSDSGQYKATSGWFGKMFDTNFQNRTGMFPDTWHTGLRFKTATILNRRVYAGNVYMKETGQSTEQSFPDRIVKSLPGQFDNFTDYDILDVTVDDGDEIVVLETFGGQLLQFKKSTLYIIDVTTEPEFIRATHRHRGVPSIHSVATTDFGVAFGNAYGAFLYNGEIVSELSTSVIEDEWKALYDGDIITGFHPEYKVLFFTNGTSSDFLVYDMVARSWMKGAGTERIDGGFKSKFFVYNNSLVSADTNSNAVEFKKWEETLSGDLTGASSITWKSKEFDFGNPSTSKFVYKVYVTYKTSGSDTSSVQMRAFYNDGTGGTNATTGVVLTGTMGATNGTWNTVELVPNPRLSCKPFDLQGAG